MDEGKKSAASFHVTPPALDFSRLLSWAHRNGIDLSAGQVACLERYLQTLLLWNRRMALVSQRDPALIVSKHIADSLFAATICRPGEAIADLGAGAGLPGIPLAIARPDCSVCLIEVRRKKVSFLLEALCRTGLSNVQVVEARVEEAARAHQRRYSLVIARALGSLPHFLRLARPLLRPGGRAVAMKGPRYRDELAAADGQLAGAGLQEEVRYRLPEGEERALLVFGFG